MNKTSTKFFTYKGKPLLRKGNVLYYGDMSEEVVAMLTVETSRKVKELDLSDTIELKLILTDPAIALQNIMVKSSVRHGLFDALDIASIWIDRFIKKQL